VKLYSSLELSSILGLDRSGARRYIRRLGIEPVCKRVTPASRGAALDHYSEEQKDAICRSRLDAGYILGLGDGSRNGALPKGQGIEKGSFYIIQLIPEYNEHRVKLGWATWVKKRLGDHRTAAPTATLVKYYPCHQSWERAAIDAITRIGCVRIGQESFDCDNLENLVIRADVWFALMPGSDTIKSGDV